VGNVDYSTWERLGEGPETDFMSICTVLNRAVRSKLWSPVTSQPLDTRIERDLRFQVIERCHTATDPNQMARSRKRRELFWIWELKTITPAGINHMV
jgi:hypothetical protein